MNLLLETVATLAVIGAWVWIAMLASGAPGDGRPVRIDPLHGLAAQACAGTGGAWPIVTPGDAAGCPRASQ